MPGASQGPASNAIATPRAAVGSWIMRREIGMRAAIPCHARRGVHEVNDPACDAMSCSADDPGFPRSDRANPTIPPPSRLTSER